MTTTTERPHAAQDARNILLTTSDVHARYGLGRTAGYALTRRSEFCRPVLPGRWRLDHLLAWEDRQAQPDPSQPDPVRATPIIPPSRRQRRAA